MKPQTKRKIIFRSAIATMTVGVATTAVLATQMNWNQTSNIAHDNLLNATNYSIFLNGKNYVFNDQVEALAFLTEKGIIEQKKVMLTTSGLKKYRNNSKTPFQNLVLEEGDVININETDKNHSMTYVAQGKDNQLFPVKISKADETRFQNIERKLANYKYKNGENITDEEKQFHKKYKQKIDNARNKARRTLLKYTDVYQFDGKLYKNKRAIFNHIMDTLKIKNQIVSDAGSANKLLKSLKGVFSVHLVSGKNVEISISNKGNNYSFANNKFNISTLSDYFINNSQVYLEKNENGEVINQAVDEEIFASEAQPQKNNYIHLRDTNYKTTYFVAMDKSTKSGKFYGDTFIKLSDSQKLEGISDSGNWKESSRKELPQEQKINNALSNILSSKMDSYIYSYVKEVAAANKDSNGEIGEISALEFLIQKWLENASIPSSVKDEISSAFQELDKTKINTLNKFWTSYTMIINRMIDLGVEVDDISKIAESYMGLATFLDQKMRQEQSNFEGNDDKIEDKMFSALPFDDLSKFDMPINSLLPILRTGTQDFSQKQGIANIKNKNTKLFKTVLLKSLIESDLVNQMSQNDALIDKNYPSETAKKINLHIDSIRQKVIDGIKLSDIAIPDSPFIQKIRNKVNNYNNAISSSGSIWDLQDKIKNIQAISDIGVIVNAFRLNMKEQKWPIIHKNVSSKFQLLPYNIKNILETLKTKTSLTKEQTNIMHLYEFKNSLYAKANEKIQEVLMLIKSSSVKSTFNTLLKNLQKNSFISNLENLKNASQKLVKSLKNEYKGGKTASLFIENAKNIGGIITSSKQLINDINIKELKDWKNQIYELFEFNGSFLDTVSKAYEVYQKSIDVVHMIQTVAEDAKEVIAKFQTLMDSISKFKKISEMMDKFKRFQKIANGISKSIKMFSKLSKLGTAVPVAGEVIMVAQMVMSVVVDIFGKHDSFTGSKSIVYSYDAGEGHVYYWDGGLKTWTFWGIFGDNQVFGKKDLHVISPLKILSSRTESFYFKGKNYDSVGGIKHKIMRNAYEKLKSNINKDSKIKLEYSQGEYYLVFQESSANFKGIGNEKFKLKVKLKEEAYKELTSGNNGFNDNELKSGNLSLGDFVKNLINTLDKKATQGTNYNIENSLISNARMSFIGTSNTIQNKSVGIAAKTISDWIENSETIVHKILVSKLSAEINKNVLQDLENGKFNAEYILMDSQDIEQDENSLKGFEEKLDEKTKNWNLESFDEQIFSSRIFDSLYLNNTSIDKKSLSDYRDSIKKIDVYRLKTLTNSITNNSMYRYFTQIDKIIDELVLIYKGGWIDVSKVVDNQVINKEEIYV